MLASNLRLTYTGSFDYIYEYVHWVRFPHIFCHQISVPNHELISQVLDRLFEVPVNGLHWIRLAYIYLPVKGLETLTHVGCISGSWENYNAIICSFFFNLWHFCHITFWHCSVTLRALFPTLITLIGSYLKFLWRKLRKTTGIKHTAKRKQWIFLTALSGSLPGLGCYTRYPNWRREKVSQVGKLYLLL